jgi:protease-4
VADGRKKDMVYIDSIAQGRVWTGGRAVQVGLVDRIGTMQDAVDCADRMAKVSDYAVKEYPEKKTILEQLMNSYKKTIKNDLIKEELGGETMQLMQQMKAVKQMIGVPQTRLPFSINVN